MATLSLKVKSTRILVKKSDELVSVRHLVSKASQAKSDEAQKWLSQQYPVVFNHFKPLPMAIGSGSVIIKSRPSGISEKAMVRALNRWTRRQAYQNAIITCDYRYHPDGSQAGKISVQHLEYARGKLEK